MGAPGISDFLDQKNVSQLNQAGSEIGLLTFRLNKSVAEVPNIEQEGQRIGLSIWSSAMF